MKKNTAKILVFFIICLLGLGKIIVDNNEKKIGRKNEIEKIVVQNKNSDKKNKNTESKKNKEKSKSNAESSSLTEKAASKSEKTDNRKYIIDYDHIIGGDENSSGKVTGGHTLLRGDVRIVKKIGKTANNGVYRASVEIRKKDGKWQKKTSNGGVNTMFPEDWNEEKVIDEINSAWENRVDFNGKDSNMWQGKSRSGVIIRGFKKPRITAYPIYEGRD